MEAKNAVEIKIFGNTYTLRGEAEPAYMHELAKLVDSKMQELAKKGGMPTHRVAILAAFNLADELLKARRQLDAERQRLDQAARVAAKLDLRLQSVLAERDESEQVAREIIIEETQQELMDDTNVGRSGPLD